MKKDLDMEPKNQYPLETFVENNFSSDNQVVYQYAHLKLLQCWHILKYLSHNIMLKYQ